MMSRTRRLVFSALLAFATFPVLANDLQYVSGLELGLLYPFDSSVGYMDIDIFRGGRHWPDYGITVSVGLVRILIQTVRYHEGVLVLDDHVTGAPIEYSFGASFPVRLTYSPVRLLQNRAYHVYPYVFGDLFLLGGVSDPDNGTQDVFGLHFNAGFAVQTDVRNILGERFDAHRQNEIFFPISLRATYHHLPRKRAFSAGLYFDLGGYFRAADESEETGS